MYRVFGDPPICYPLPQGGEVAAEVISWTPREWFCASNRLAAVFLLLLLAWGCRAPTAPPLVAAAPSLSLIQPVSHQEAIPPESQPRPDNAPTLHGEAPQALAAEELPALEPMDSRAAGTLKLQQLEAVAIANSPAVAEAAARVDAQRGVWLQVGLPTNPVMGYLADDVGEEGSAGRHGLYVGKQFLRGGKLGLRRSVAQRAIEQAEQELAVVEGQIRADVRLAAVHWLISVKRVAITGELVAIGEKVIRDTRILLQRGEVRQAELLRAEVEAGTLRVTQLQAQNQELAARRVLATRVGVAENDLPSIRGEELDRELRRASANRILRQPALNRLLAESPEVASAVVEIERARWNVRQERAEGVPNHNLQLSVQQSDITDDTIAGAQWSMPLPVHNWNQGAVQQARAELRAAEQSLLDLQRRLSVRFEQVFQRYRTSQEQLETYANPQTGIIALARESLRLTAIGYESDELGSLDMLTAQRAYAQAQLSYLDILNELWQAGVEIDTLLLGGRRGLGSTPVR